MGLRGWEQPPDLPQWLTPSRGAAACLSSLLPSRALPHHVSSFKLTKCWAVTSPVPPWPRVSPPSPPLALPGLSHLGDVPPSSLNPRPVTHCNQLLSKHGVPCSSSTPCHHRWLLCHPGALSLQPSRSLLLRPLSCRAPTALLSPAHLPSASSPRALVFTTSCLQNAFVFICCVALCPFQAAPSPNQKPLPPAMTEQHPECFVRDGAMPVGSPRLLTGPYQRTQ